MAVIELAKPGLEATTCELIVTVANAGGLVNGIISTQLLYPMDAVGCDDDTTCDSSNQVIVTSQSSFDASNGPARFTNYCLLLVGITVGACLLFTPFLPASKEECYEWKAYGDKVGASKTRGKIALAVCVITVLVSSIKYLETIFYRLVYLVRFFDGYSIARPGNSLRVCCGWVRVLNGEPIRNSHIFFEYCFRIDAKFPLRMSIIVIDLILCPVIFGLSILIKFIRITF